MRNRSTDTERDGYFDLGKTKNLILNGSSEEFNRLYRRILSIKCRMYQFTSFKRNPEENYRRNGVKEGSDLGLKEKKERKESRKENRVKQKEESYKGMKERPRLPEA